MDASLIEQLYLAQQYEITEYHIYSKLARVIANKQNAAILRGIAEDERRHHDFWKGYTQREASAKRWKIFFFYWISRIFGITFGIKLMERGEEQAQINYTRIAASFSMAASEYLSTKSEGRGERAVKSSIYTGVAYIVTVFLLILPYLLIANYFICLALTLGIALLIIFFFNFYISIAKDYSFKRRFLEMAALSLGVAALTFAIGFLIRKTLGIEV